MRTFVDLHPTRNSGNHIFIKIPKEGDTKFIRRLDIIKVKTADSKLAKGAVTQIHYLSGKNEVFVTTVSKTLLYWQQKLESSFIRPNRSELVNVDYIKRIETKEGWVIILDHPTSKEARIPITHKGRIQIEEYLDGKI